jgi:hypothetical protein
MEFGAMGEYSSGMFTDRKNFVGLLAPEAAQPNASIATA